MTQGARLLEAVMGYLGTPFWEHGRVPGTSEGCGIDCVGIVACGLAEIGVPYEDQDYMLGPFHDHSALMETAFDAVFDRIDLDAPRLTGDVLIFKWPLMNNHAAVLVKDNLIVHSVQGSDVRLTPMDYSLRARVVSVWRLPEVA